jgi:hypothetical protein
MLVHQKIGLVLLNGCLAAALAHAEGLRSWTNSEGRKVEAELVGVKDDKAELKLADGRVVPFDITKLSAADQEYVRAMESKLTATAALGLSTLPPPEKRVWPGSVEAPRTAVEVKLVASDEAARKYVYRSEAFEFTSQANLLPGLVKSVAQTFEATRRLINALPWGITCRPPEGSAFYQAALYQTRNDYISAGGPPNSGGVYMTREKIFKIPFESLGIEQLGQSFTRSEHYSSDTLVHEITHQLMHDYLNHLPTWVVEGTAEYAEMLPYNGGKFRVSGAESGLKDYLEGFKRRGLAPALPELASFFNLPRSEWDRIATSASSRMAELYQQSAVLVYFFNHLDGDGRGLRFIRYMDATRSQMIQWEGYERALAAYRMEMDEFFKLPGVRRLEGGRFSFPPNVTPPKPPETPGGQRFDESTAMKQLHVLLDGRGLEQLQQELQTKMETVVRGLSVRKL